MSSSDLAKLCPRFLHSHLYKNRVTVRGLIPFMLGKGSGSVKVLKSNARDVSSGSGEIVTLCNKGGNLGNLLEMR